MKSKILNSIKSGVGSYILLILINYIIYLLSGWSIMDEMIPGFNKDFFAVSDFYYYNIIKENINKSLLYIN